MHEYLGQTLLLLLCLFFFVCQLCGAGRAAAAVAEVGSARPPLHFFSLVVLVTSGAGRGASSLPTFLPLFVFYSLLPSFLSFVDPFVSVLYFLLFHFVLPLLPSSFLDSSSLSSPPLPRPPSRAPLSVVPAGQGHGRPPLGHISAPRGERRRSCQASRRRTSPRDPDVRGVLLTTRGGWCGVFLR